MSVSALGWMGVSAPARCILPNEATDNPKFPDAPCGRALYLALRRMPRLETIELKTHKWRGPQEARSIGVHSAHSSAHPDCEMREVQLYSAMRAFGLVLRAFLPRGTEDIGGTHSRLKKLSIKAPFPIDQLPWENTCRRFAKLLTKVRLEIALKSPYPSNPTAVPSSWRLRTFLSTITNVKHLCLRFPEDLHGPRVPHSYLTPYHGDLTFRALNRYHIHMPARERLHISNLSVDDAEISKNFLGRHHATLRNLRFSNLILAGGTRGPSCGPWGQISGWKS